MLTKMGFTTTSWVSQVMRCVSGAKYSFQVNGKVRGNVSATRGLRWGDPISLHLFILMAEAISCLIE